MPFNLAHRRLWSPGELSGAELRMVLEAAVATKRMTLRSGGWRPLGGRHVALLCRDQDAGCKQFDLALSEIGASVALLDTSAWLDDPGRKVPEAAHLLGRLYDVIDCCDLPPAAIEEIDRHAGVPVFNGLARPEHAAHLLAAALTLREVPGRPLEELKVRLDGDPGAAAYQEAERLLAQAGIRLQRSTPVAIAAGGEAPPDEPDAVLELPAPPARCRLVVPHAPAAEQARVDALFAEHQRCVLQALIVGALP